MGKDKEGWRPQMSRRVGVPLGLELVRKWAGVRSPRVWVCEEHGGTCRTVWGSG